MSRHGGPMPCALHPALPEPRLFKPSAFLATDTVPPSPAQGEQSAVPCWHHSAHAQAVGTQCQQKRLPASLCSGSVMSC